MGGINTSLGSMQGLSEDIVFILRIGSTIEFHSCTDHKECLRNREEQ